MKKFLLSSVALLGFTAGAMAADLPRRAPPVFVPVPVFTWTGFYVGVNAGYGWNNGDDNTCLGCSNDWFATARVRVGYAFDRVLVYATGGIAFTDHSGNNRGFGGFNSGAQLPAAFYVSPGAALTGSFVGNGGGLFGKSNSNDTGWVLGAGVEYAWTNNLTGQARRLVGQHGQRQQQQLRRRQRHRRRLEHRRCDPRHWRRLRAEQQRRRQRVLHRPHRRELEVRQLSRIGLGMLRARRKPGPLLFAHARADGSSWRHRGSRRGPGVGSSTSPTFSWR